MFATLGYYICVPFAWILRFFYSLTNSYGMALILFTLVVKVVVLPFQIKSKKSMIRMNRFQPKIREVQAKYANNQARMNEELQMLYAQEGISPMSGCLWSLIPFPILLALYSIIRKPLSRFMLIKTGVVEEITAFATGMGYIAGDARIGFEEIGLAQFISKNFEVFTAQFPNASLIRMDYSFLGLDLTVMPGEVWKQVLTGGWPVIGLVLIPIVSAALSYVQSKLTMAGQSGANGSDAAARSNRMMTWMMPLMSLWIGFTLPAALGVYWIANSVFMAIQEAILNKHFLTAMEKEETEQEKAKREARLKKMQEAREMQRRRQEENEKKSLKEKRAEKLAEKQADKARKSGTTTENGRIGDRPYARGRSFDKSHYGE